MSKKTTVIVCLLVYLLAVIVYFIWTYFDKSHQYAWTIFVVCTLICAAASKIATRQQDQKEIEAPQQNTEEEST